MSATAAVLLLILGLCTVARGGDIEACDPGVCECTSQAGTSGTTETVNCASRQPWYSDSTGTLKFDARTTIVSLASIGLSCLACPKPSPAIELGNLNLLTKLTVTNNDLVELEDGAFLGLESLTTIDVVHNRIASIGTQTFKYDGAEKLEVLKLSHNALQSLENGVFDDLVGMEQLWLDNNQLTGLPGGRGLFLQTSSLTTLHLESNKITTSSATNGLVDESLKGMTQLTHLYLQSNQMTVLRDLLFADLVSLESIYLDSNRLTDVTSAKFGNSSTLVEVHLTDNALVSLSTNAQETLSSVNKLTVAGSFWDCCALDWMIAMGAKVPDISAVMCNRPQTFKGISLSQAKITVTDKLADYRECLINVPSTPVGLNDAGKSSTSLDLSWNTVPGNAFAVDYYLLEYALGDTNLTDADYKSVTCPSGNLPPKVGADLATDSACTIHTVAGQNTYQITQFNLFKYKPYSFRLKAHSPLPGTAADGGSWSAWSTPSNTFVTAEDKPGKMIEPIVKAASSTSLDVSWIAPAEPNGVIEKYVVEYVRNDKPLFTQPTALEPEPRNAMKLTIPNLIAAVKYRISVTAYTVLGAGNTSDIAIRPTLEDAPFRPAKAPELANTEDNVTATTLVLTWDEPPVEDRNGVIIGYTLYYTCYPQENSNKTVIEGFGYLAKPATTRYISNLVPASTYTVHLTAHTAAGESARSAALIVSTLDAAPSGQGPVTAVPLSSTSIRLNWALPFLKNGDIMAYKITMKAVQGGSGSNKNLTDFLELNARGDETTLLVTRLIPATNYEIKISSSTRLAYSNYSEAIYMQTLDDTPAVVSCTAETVDSTTTKITWSEPVPTNGLILEYQVVQVEKKRTIAMYETYVVLEDLAVFNWSITTGGAFFYQHENLDPYTRYTYSVRARTSSQSWSSLSFQASTTTLEDNPTGQQPPTVRILGATSMQVFWSLPTMANGEITKFQLHHLQGEGVLPIYTGIPPTAIDRKRTVNITGLSPGTSYEVTVTTFTAVGGSQRSVVTAAETISTDPSASTATVIAVVCVFVFILSIGFMWEHKVKGSLLEKSGENTIGPDGDILLDIDQPVLYGQGPNPSNALVPPGQSGYRDGFATGPNADFRGLNPDPFQGLDLRTGSGRTRSASESSSSSGSSFSESGGRESSAA